MHALAAAAPDAGTSCSAVGLLLCTAAVAAALLQSMYCTRGPLVQLIERTDHLIHAAWAQQHQIKSCCQSGSCCSRGPWQHSMLQWWRTNTHNVILSRLCSAAVSLRLESVMVAAQGNSRAYVRLTSIELELLNPTPRLLVCGHLQIILLLQGCLLPKDSLTQTHFAT